MSNFIKEMVSISRYSLTIPEYSSYFSTHAGYLKKLASHVLYFFSSICLIAVVTISVPTIPLCSRFESKFLIDNNVVPSQEKIEFNFTAAALMKKGNIFRLWITNPKNFRFFNYKGKIETFFILKKEVLGTPSHTKNFWKIV